MSYHSFVITRLCNFPNIHLLLDSENAAINVISDKGLYAVQVGTTDGEMFHANVCPVERYEISQGMTPEQIAEAELEVLGENPYIMAFVNGVPYRKS